jgi:hypothetical protein
MGMPMGGDCRIVEKGLKTLIYPEFRTILNPF